MLRGQVEKVLSRWSEVCKKTKHILGLVGGGEVRMTLASRMIGDARHEMKTVILDEGE